MVFTHPRRTFVIGFVVILIRTREGHRKGAMDD